MKALKVTAKREGFRRGGRAWSAQGTIVPLGQLTAGEVEQLFAEPMLVVEGITIKEPPVEPDGGGEGGAGGDGGSNGETKDPAGSKPAPKPKATKPAPKAKE